MPSRGSFWLKRRCPFQLTGPSSLWIDGPGLVTLFCFLFLALPLRVSPGVCVLQRTVSDSFVRGLSAWPSLCTRDCCAEHILSSSCEHRKQGL